MSDTKRAYDAAIHSDAAHSRVRPFVVSLICGLTNSKPAQKIPSDKQSFRGPRVNRLSNDDDNVTLNIPRAEKVRRLSAMDESEFRDRIVRPLFFACGYADGRDLHGPDEEGKDILFEENDRFGEKRIVCVQTKKGNINLSSVPSQNIQTAITQLRTALNSRVARVEDRQKYYPDEVFLCSSGKINTKARNHIADELQKDRRVRFLDAELIIRLIDEKCPHLWQGISVDIFAHYDCIRRQVEEHETDGDLIASSAANDGAFVQLTFYRETTRRVKHRGHARNEMSFEELQIPKIVSGPPRTILVIGDAGSGKSTALWRIAYETVKRDEGKGQQIPIVVSARHLNEDNVTQHGFVNEVRRLSSDFASVSDALFRDVDLERGRVVLLVDGLDEITDTEQRKRIVGAITRFCAEYHRCSVVVTTRPDVETERDFRANGIKAYDVAPISWSQVEKIVRRVLKSRSLSGAQLESVRKGTQQVLRQIEEVHGFQLTPLLATVYAAAAEYSRSDVPANVTELFKKYVELMLGRWDEQKGLKQQFHAPLKDFLLQRIAYRMHVDRKLYVSRSEFSAIVTELLEERGHRLETPDIEDELLSRSRLLRTRGTEVSFSHLLLQEFFAGRSIPEDKVVGHIDDSWWTKPIVFYYGDRADRANHLRNVQRSLLRRNTQSVVSHRTVGIAMQASYLSLVKDRLEIWITMTKMLSEYTTNEISNPEQKKLFPIMEMTFDYIQLRDAVPFSALSDPVVREQILSSVQHLEKEHSNVAEAMRFWFIVALLETGLVKEAYGALEEWTFEEPKYYFWICMGAFFIERIVPVSQEQKDSAKNIRQKYMDRVVSMRREFVREHRTLLFERRGDRIVDSTKTPTGD